MNHIKGKHLKYCIDRYLCANIGPKSMPVNTEVDSFRELLSNTETDCKLNNIKSIFLNISQSDSQLVQTAVQSGFTFHYVQDNALCLYKKLRPNHIPNYATHHIGAGGAVFSKDFKRVLTIQGNWIFIEFIINIW